MTKLTANTILSLDGVMQGPGGPDEDRDGGFDRGGWAVPFAQDEGFFEETSKWIAGAGGLLLGRRTYEIFAGHWPRITDEDNPIATVLNRVPKYVASRTLDRLEWDNSTLLQGDVADAVAALKRGDGAELQVHGSGDLLQTLLRHDLVDEYRLWFIPVVVGSGKRLFADGAVPRSMRLVDTKAMPTGAMLHVYAPSGALEYGSFALEDE